MRKTVRVNISDQMVAMHDSLDLVIHMIQTMFTSLDAAEYQIRTWRDIATRSTVVEMTKEITAPFVQSHPSQVAWQHPGMPGSAWISSTWATTGTRPMKVYLSHDDDLTLPEEPEPMWTTGPVIGWRRFAVYPNSNEQDILVGPTGKPWQTSTLIARCLHESKTSRHVAPAWDCECGIYAMTYPPSMSTSFNVLAEVELSGRVIEHEYGYRAEKATILRLWSPKELQGTLADRYKVPVILRRNR